MNRPNGMPLTIENLVGANGNYIVVYVYCNYGDNILFMLPNFQIDEEEKEINDAVINITDSSFEEYYLVEQFLSEFPNTPFIARARSILECTKVMNARLGCISDFNTFINYTHEFNKWRKVVYKVSKEDGLECKAYHDGWRSLI